MREFVKKTNRNGRGVLNLMELLSFILNIKKTYDFGVGTFVLSIKRNLT